MLPLLAALAACGGNVVVEGAGAGSPSGSGGAPTPGSTTVGATTVGATTSNATASASTTSSVTSSSATGAPDAGPTVCDDPSVCSRIISRDGTCGGAAKVGDFCDYLGTPCSATPADCTAVGHAFGSHATPTSCGPGLTWCLVNWTGTLDQASFDATCAERASTGLPLDCLQD